MDDMRLTVLAEKRSNAEKAEEKAEISERPLTGRLFDALFPTKRK
jgi:hypothetical protein